MIGRLLVIIALASSQVSFAAVQLNVERTEISVNDSFVLVVRGTESESLRNADYRPLERDFSIGGASDKSAITIKNGQTTRVSELHIELTPKRTGSLVIPALKVDGYLTNPIQITVKEKRQDVYARELFFVETQVDKNQVYIQEQLLLYVRVYRAVEIEELGYDGLELESADFQRVGSNTFNRNIDGLNYRINELVFAVFPHRSGVLNIPSVEFKGRQRTRSRSIFDRGTQVRRRSEPLTVTVKPVPVSFPGQDWRAHNCQPWRHRLSVASRYTRINPLLKILPRKLAFPPWVLTVAPGWSPSLENTMYQPWKFPGGIPNRTDCESPGYLLAHFRLSLAPTRLPANKLRQ